METEMQKELFEKIGSEGTQALLEEFLKSIEERLRLIEEKLDVIDTKVTLKEKKKFCDFFPGMNFAGPGTKLNLGLNPEDTETTHDIEMTEDTDDIEMAEEDEYETTETTEEDDDDEDDEYEVIEITETKETTETTETTKYDENDDDDNENYCQLFSPIMLELDKEEERIRQEEAFELQRNYNERTMIIDNKYIKTIRLGELGIEKLLEEKKKCYDMRMQIIESYNEKFREIKRKREQIKQSLKEMLFQK
ncbi:nucleolar transcription factor 1-like [Hydra vulgaris]|uniref:nucleolar transcription factor 1-like n=1 Tax=Hydra vulgaris TaxID=6087 RepID=UPI0032EA814D